MSGGLETEQSPLVLHQLADVDSVLVEDSILSAEELRLTGSRDEIAELSAAEDLDDCGENSTGVDLLQEQSMQLLLGQHSDDVVQKTGQTTSMVLGHDCNVMENFSTFFYSVVHLSKPVVLY